MRRWFSILCLCLAFAAVANAGVARPVSAATPPTTEDASGTTTTTIDNSFMETQRDIDQCIGSSNELPGCGREPEASGDRGGSMQYLTLGVMVAGLAIVFWRVARAVRARDAALSQLAAGRSE